jgi:hypothetical protein
MGLKGAERQSEQVWNRALIELPLERRGDWSGAGFLRFAQNDT